MARRSLSRVVDNCMQLLVRVYNKHYYQCQDNENRLNITVVG